MAESYLLAQSCLKSITVAPKIGNLVACSLANIWVCWLSSWTNCTQCEDYCVINRCCIRWGMEVAFTNQLTDREEIRSGPQNQIASPDDDCFGLFPWSKILLRDRDSNISRQTESGRVATVGAIMFKELNKSTDWKLDLLSISLELGQ